jgi:hypothetical protein
MSRKARERKRGLRWYGNYDTYMARMGRMWGRWNRSARSQRPHMVETECSWEHVNDLVAKSVIHKGRKP